ncbi:MAG TPA: TlpA disulfide reductase family protein [Saprospiraceae bacterium]|nr:TlpA disulfide reductase family protein [Saprospiraceae bacterium]
MKIGLTIKNLLFLPTIFLGVIFLLSQKALEAQTTIHVKGINNGLTVELYNFVSRKFELKTLTNKNNNLTTQIGLPYYTKVKTYSDSLFILLTDNSQIELHIDKKGNISTLKDGPFFSPKNIYSKEVELLEKINKYNENPTFYPDREEMLALVSQGAFYYPQFQSLTQRYLSSLTRHLPKSIVEFYILDKKDVLTAEEKQEFKNIIVLFEKTKESNAIGTQKYLLMESAFTRSEQQRIKMIDKNIKAYIDSLIVDGAIDMHPNKNSLIDLLDIVNAELNGMEKFKTILRNNGDKVISINPILVDQNLSIKEKNFIIEKALYNNLMYLMRKYEPDLNIGLLLMNRNDETIETISNLNDNQVQYYTYDAFRALNDLDTVKLNSIIDKISDTDKFPKSLFLQLQTEKYKLVQNLSNLKTSYTVYENAEMSGQEILEIIHKNNKGKVVYLDMWATWCGPCKAEFKVSKPMKMFYKDKDVAFVYLCGGRCNREDLEREATKYEISGDHYILTNKQESEVFEIFKTNFYPTYKIMNKSGQIIPGLAKRPSELDDLIQQIHPFLISIE